ncbi:MAG: DUF6266 family protein [Ferruginibacter sp.]
MGKFTGNAILSGVIGPVIASNWRGISYLKSKGHVSKKKRSPKQLEHQAKVGMVSTFVYSMKALLERTFISFAIDKTGTNAAFSYNFKNCVAGESPAFFIDYSLVLVSRGDLPNAAAPLVAVGDNGQVGFQWIDNSGTGQAKPTDKCIAVVYCPELNSTIYSNGDETRKDGSLLLDAHLLTGKTVETWLVIIAANGVEVANSVYTGQVVVL